MSGRRVQVFWSVSVVALAGAALVAALVLGRGSDAPPRDGWMAQFTVNETPLPMPATALFDADGREAGLDALTGRVVLVNFWATWCAPCLREMPSLAALQKRFSGSPFTVLAVSIDRDGPSVTGPFLERLGIDGLEVLFDRNTAMMRALGLRSLPTSVLLDRRGRRVGRLEGPAEWDSPEAEALIRHYLEH